MGRGKAQLGRDTVAVAAVLASGHVGDGSGRWWEPVWPERAALFEKKYELGKKKKRKTRLVGKATQEETVGQVAHGSHCRGCLSFAFFRVLERISGREMGEGDGEGDGVGNS